MEKFQGKGAFREIENFFGAGIRASAAVLVGGQSRRMGLNKALLKIGSGRLIENITAKLKTLFPEVLLAGSDPEPYVSLGLPVVGDVYRGCGPLAGIHAALTAAANPYVFIMACDLPFVDLELVAFLVKNAPGHDAVVPRLGAYLEPLCAVYGKGCLPAIETSLNKGRCKVTAFFPEVAVKYLDQEELSGFNLDRIFFNLNSPKDLKKAIELGKSLS